MKNTFIALAILALSSAALAQTSTCNGTGACSPDERANTTTVGDNRNGQIATGGSIANGANVQAYGGVSRNTNTTGASTSSSTTGASTSNATSGPSTSTSTSGASTSSSTGGTVGNTSASVAAGAVQNTINAGTHTATIGNTSSSSGGNTLTGGTVSGVAGVNGGINISSATTADVAGIQAQADRDVARTNSDAVRYVSDHQLRNTPNVATAALTSSNDTCMGSVSAGGSGPGFSIAVGSTYKDSNCVMLKNSRELWNMGFKAAAVALMCTDSSNKEALELTGYVCPQTAKDQQRVSANASAPSQQYTDPIVRDRMGLPALK